MTQPIRHVRTRAGAERFDQRVGEVIHAKGSAEAKEQWDAKKWQAATASASVVVALAVGLATILGLVSEIVFAILLLALLGLNAAVKALTNPRPKAATGRKRTTRHVVRRRGPARRTRR